MASKYGGIELEDQSSKYGGVPESKWRELLEPESSWAGLPGSIDWRQSKESLPESAKNAAIALTAPIHSPIETAKGMGKFGMEAIKKSLHSQLRSWVNVLYDHDIGVSDTDVDKMVDHYSQRYGTPEGIKEAIENDPAGVLVDGLSVVYGAPSALKAVSHSAAKMTPDGLPERMYESAGKFSTIGSQAERDKVIHTLLENKVPLNEGGVRKVADMIESLDQKIDKAIKDHDFGSAYPREFPVRTLENLAKEQIGQLGGGHDAKVIREVFDDYISDLSEMNSKTMTLAELQQWKKNAYKRINWKVADEKQTAKNKAYKEAAGVARKDIEDLTPGSDVAGMNRLEGDLINALDPLTRATLRTRNGNLLGMDKTLAPMSGGAGAYAFGIDPAIGYGLGAIKSGLGSPSIKTKMAIGLHHGKKPIDPAYDQLTKAMAAAYLNSPANRQ